MDIIKGSIPLGLIAVIAGAVLPISIQAADLQARGPIPFSAFDRDGSGFITAAEFDVTRNERLAIKASENRPMQGMVNMPTFSDLDIDGDQRISKEELTAGQNAQMQARREMMGQGMGQGMGKGQGMGMGRNMPTFADFDTDEDGKIVEAEFLESRQQRINEMAQQGRQMKNVSRAPSFTDIDLNDDGEISRDEFVLHQPLQLY